MRLVKIIAFLVAALIVVVGGGNWLALNQRVANALSQDYRNKNINMVAYLAYGIYYRELVLDLRSISGSASMADVDRVLLTSLKALKDYSFSKVILAHSGERKFQMSGTYARTLGEEYGTQNVLYTMRTMPENIYKLDGSPAFGTWTGGWLGVMNKQMEEHQKFHDQWWMDAGSL